MEQVDGRRLNIAVSGINATANPGPGVSTIRAIRKSGEFDGIITGLAYNPLDPGVYMEGICDNVFLVPYPSEGAENLLDRLGEIHETAPLDVIIPTLDAELGAYIKIDPDLRGMGIRTFLPTEEGLRLRSKASLAGLKDLGIRVPRGRAVMDVGAIHRLHRELDFPVIVKGQFYGAHIAYSPTEAERYFHRFSSEWGLPVVIQELIIGDEYDVVALGDGNGSLLGAVPMKKMQLTEEGKAWGGITISDPELTGFVREIVSKLRWRGPCEIEVIRSRKDGRYYLIEINPRFPAWCYLSAGAGQNLPWATVMLAMGEGVPELPPYRVGTMFLRNSVDQVYSLSEYEEITTAGQIVRTGMPLNKES